MPALPAASYLADGLVISSILSILSLGMFLNNATTSAIGIKVCLPSICTITPSFPLRLIWSFWRSMITPGAFSSTSRAVLPLAIILLATFTIVLSIFCSTKGRLARTVTSFNCSESGANIKTGIFSSLSPDNIENTELNVCLKPTAEALRKYFPARILSIVKRPAASVIDPLTRLESFKVNSKTLALAMAVFSLSANIPDRLVCARLVLDMLIRPKKYKQVCAFIHSKG